MMSPLLSQFESEVLVALVGGHEARAGLKERMRALNEWEVARRCGATELGYVEFADHPSREVVMAALMTLKRHELLEVWDRGVRYDTFVPTAEGILLATGGEISPTSLSISIPISFDEEAPLQQVSVTGEGPMVARLDEIIRLLRSIESKQQQGR